MRRYRILILAIVLLFTCSLFAGCIPDFIGTGDETGDGGSISDSLDVLTEITTVQTSNVGKYYDNIADLVEIIKDSVVEIETISSSSTQVTSGAGSGVLFGISEEKYYVVTNHHVIDSANMVWVRLTNGERYSASIVGSVADADVAVLTISREGIDPSVYKTITIPSDGYKTRVGDTAIAIGNPLGTLGGSVTQGIVSALDREINLEGTIMNVMQTDAAANPGSSGGGLFDAYGQLIGIVNGGSAVEGVEGINFAIPVKVVVNTASSIILNAGKGGRVSIGIRAVSLPTDEAIEEFLAGLTGNTKLAWEGIFQSTEYETGVYVASVDNPYCALEAGDYIVSIDDVVISSGEDISAVLAEHKVGDRVSVLVMRAGTIIQEEITLIEMLD